MDMLSVSLVFFGVIAIIVFLGILGSFFTVETAQVRHRPATWKVRACGRTWLELEDAVP